MYFDSLNNFEEFFQSIKTHKLGAETSAKFQPRKKPIEIQSLDASIKKPKNVDLHSVIQTVKFLKYLRQMQTCLYAEFGLNLDECRRVGKIAEVIERATRDETKQLVNFVREEVVGTGTEAERSKQNVLNQMIDLMMKRQMATRIVLDAKELKYFLEVLDLGFFEEIKEDILNEDFENIGKYHLKTNGAEKVEKMNEKKRSEPEIRYLLSPPSKQTPIIEFTDSEGSKKGTSSKKQRKSREQIMEILSRSQIMKGAPEETEKVNQSTEVRLNQEEMIEREQRKGFRSLGDPMQSDIANMYKELISHQQKTDNNAEEERREKEAREEKKGQEQEKGEREKRGEREEGKEGESKGDNEEERNQAKANEEERQTKEKETQEREENQNKENGAKAKEVNSQVEENKQIILENVDKPSNNENKNTENNQQKELNTNSKLNVKLKTFLNLENIK